MHACQCSQVELAEPTTDELTATGRFSVVYAPTPERDTDATYADHRSTRTCTLSLQKRQFISACAVDVCTLTQPLLHNLPTPNKHDSLSSVSPSQTCLETFHHHRPFASQRSPASINGLSRHHLEVTQLQGITSCPLDTEPSGKLESAPSFVLKDDGTTKPKDPYIYVLVGGSCCTWWCMATMCCDWVQTRWILCVVTAMSV